MRVEPSWIMTGTDSGSGEHVEMRGCDLFQFADNKITRKDAFRKERRAWQ